MNNLTKRFEAFWKLRKRLQRIRPTVLPLGRKIKKKNVDSLSKRTNWIHYAEKTDRSRIDKNQADVQEEMNTAVKFNL